MSIEQVPTSGGPAVPNGHRRAHLPTRLSHQLRTSGADGPLLVDVASSAAYGAPQKQLPADKSLPAKELAATTQPPNALSGSTLGAAAQAVGAGHSVVLWLGLALLATTAVGVGAAILRARR